MRIVALCLLAFALCAKGEQDFITFPSNVDWVTRESPHFTALYRRGQDPLAVRALKHAERAYQVLTPIFPKGPERTWMVLADFQDSTNGYALDVPYPHMVIFAAPPEPSGLLAGLDDWLASVILHEYVHILHIYPAGGLWVPLRAIFGSWVMPNALMPSHLHEGIATLLETEMTGGGRGRGAPFHMYRRKAVEAGVWGKDFAPLDLLDGSSIRWPHGVSPYFFGYQMYESLWKSRGPKGIYKLTEASSNNWPFFVNTPLEEVYGVDYQLLWERIFAMGGEAARKEIEELKKTPLSKLTYLTADKGSKWDLTAGPGAGKVAFRSAGFDRKAEIVLYDAADRKRIKAFDMPRGSNEGLCWGGIGDKEGLFLSETVSEYSYNKTVLKYLNVPSGQKYRVDVDGAPFEHVHTIGCSADLGTVFVYRETGGIGFIVELKPTLPSAGVAGKTARGRQWKIPESTFISGITVDDSQNAWFVIREGTTSQLWKWAPKESTPAKVSEMPGHLYSLRSWGGHLYGIWDKDGRMEVWELDTSKGDARKWISLSGGANSFARAGNRWVLSSYEHGGYDVAEAQPVSETTAKHANLKTEAIAARKALGARKPAADVAMTEPQDYSAWSTLRPRFWVPFLLLVPDGMQISAWIPGFDIGQRHFYGIYAGYDTRGQGSGYVSLSHSYRFGLATQLSSSMYFQPSYIISTGTMLTQWGGSVSIAGRPFNWDPTLSFGFVFKKLEASAANAVPTTSIGPSATVSYSFGVSQLPSSILPQWGSAMSLSVAGFPQQLGSTDRYGYAIATWLQYFPVPWNREHGFFIRARAGYTDGTSRINSYFEGGGELNFSFGRGPFLNRGFLPGALFGRRNVTLNAEYHMLLGRPERGYGLTPLFFRSWDLAFVGDLTTYDLGIDAPPARNRNPSDIFKIYYASFGAELKGNFKLGWYLPMSLRLGLYHGIGGSGGRRPKGEPLYVTVALEGAFF